MDKKARFNYLLNQYLKENMAAEEHDEFFTLLSSGEYDELLANSLHHDLEHGLPGNSNDLPPHIAQEIVRNIYQSEKNTVKVLPVKRPVRKMFSIMAAASIVAILVSVFFFINKPSHKKTGFASLIPSTTIVKKNNTGKQEAVLLQDGTTVVLDPGSTLHYSKKFDGLQRQVYLEGSAFFQVAKNPEKPFLVYYNNIITKVLGTSFDIRTIDKTGNVEVSVKTGRVQVYENEKMMENDVPVSSVIVTPNQKAVYQAGKRLLETSLVAAPEPIIENSTKQTEKKNLFVYDQEKLEDIFTEMEKVYGIEIVVENTNLNNCVFTGDVSNQDLFTKLKIICLTTNSSYEINGTKILVTGKGCQ